MMKRNVILQHVSFFAVILGELSGPPDQCNYAQLLEDVTSPWGHETCGAKQHDVYSQVKLLARYADTEAQDRRLLADATACVAELRRKIALLVSLYWK